MIHEAQVTVAGYVATDPKFKKVAGDISSAKLRVATRHAAAIRRPANGRTGLPRS